jgi:hypothetical protein
MGSATAAPRPAIFLITRPPKRKNKLLTLHLPFTKFFRQLSAGSLTSTGKFLPFNSTLRVPALTSGVTISTADEEKNEDYC